MALRGSLENFGVADVFSLIGSQNKSGVLNLVSRDEKVALSFVEGAVVHAFASGRQKQDLLGNILVRAEVITATQLQTALSQQQQNKRRLGDQLLSMGGVTTMDLQTFAKLQSTETVYRVFLWRSGTYEFNQGEEAPELRHPPVRAEALLMEGFRQADEWPALRRKISSYATKFTVQTNLDDLLAADAMAEPAEGAAGGAPKGAADDFFGDMDFGDGSNPSGNMDPRLRNIGSSERLVYSLINPQRDVQKLIDLSRLGEFDTCKALVNLMDASIISLVATKGAAQAAKPSAEATVGGISAQQDRGLGSSLGLRIGWAFAMLVAWVLLCHSGLDVMANSTHRRAAYLDMHLELELGRGTLQHIHHALAVYHAAHNEYPETLDALVVDGLLGQGELRFPWQEAYYYNRGERGYTLLRPIF